MSHFLVDGKERGWPMTGDVTVAELLDYIRENFNSDRILVSNVKINGQEISAQDERTLAPIPVSTLESVEVLTAHPRELAEETLQMLIPFTEHLARLSLAASGCAGPDAPGARQATEAAFRKLVDALGTFSGAIDSVRGVLRIGDPDGEAAANTEPLHQQISALETGMITILRRILKAREAGQVAEAETLLSQDLVANLASWHDAGIPALIRARDS